MNDNSQAQPATKAPGSRSLTFALGATALIVVVGMLPAISWPTMAASIARQHPDISWWGPASVALFEALRWTLPFTLETARPMQSEVGYDWEGRITSAAGSLSHSLLAASFGLAMSMALGDDTMLLAVPCTLAALAPALLPAAFRSIARAWGARHD